MASYACIRRGTTGRRPDDMSPPTALRRPRFGSVQSMAAEVLPLEPGDDEVGRRFAAGDEQALAWAYERWAGQLHGMAVRAFGRGPDAEDVTQQAFVSAWTGRGGYSPDRGPLPAWLIGICRHKIADTWARLDRQRRVLAAAAAEVPPSSGALDSAVADRVLLLGELDR